MRLSANTAGPRAYRVQDRRTDIQSFAGQYCATIRRSIHSCSDVPGRRTVRSADTSSLIVPPAPVELSTVGSRTFWGATISATNHISHSHMGHSKTISATAKKPYRPHGKSISATKIYGEFIWRYRVDTSLFRVVSIVNLNVKLRIRR